MKILISIGLILFSISCSAQNRLSDIRGNAIIKSNLTSYKITKNGGFEIENMQNKFIGVKQRTPNLPINMNLYPYYIKKDISLLLKICAQNIDVNKLEKLAKIKYNGFLVTVKCDEDGKVIDVSFYTKEANSALSVTEFEGIERQLKSSAFIN
ncbi:MAG: hypothetical protein ACO1N4_03130 [Pedobacter sp.]